MTPDHARCQVCGERRQPGHQCKPAWDVRAEDESDEWRQVRAKDAEQAACNFVRSRDSFSEYGRVINEMAVLVRPAFTEQEPVRYVVYGEIVPSYVATRQIIEK